MQETLWQAFLWLLPWFSLLAHPWVLGAMAVGVILGFVGRKPAPSYHHVSVPKLPGFGHKLVYSDEKPTHPVAGVTYCKILASEQYDIIGKPDFIYQKGRGFIPTELKSHALGEKSALSPRPKDLHQLYMYFLIVGETYGPVPYGWLIYRDCMFKVRNTRRARQTIIQLLVDMRRMLATGDGEPNPSFINCKHCICRETVCDYHD